MNVRVFGITVAVTVASALAGYSLYHVQQSSSDPAPTGIPQADTGAAKLETPISDWSFADLKGERQKLDNWAGKVMVVNFWATWCPPCMREIPMFMMLQERYRDQGLQFIGIAIDRVENVAMFAQQQGINYPLLVGQEDVAVFMQSLGNEIGALPYTAVIGRDGHLRFSHQGEWSQQEAETVFKTIL